jgi:proteasome accessory factor B
MKLAAGLHGDSGIAVHELAEAISFRPQGLAEAELETFQVLAQATLRQETVVFDYLPLHRETAEERRVNPYHLGCLANQWYLIGLDAARDAMRTFALTRIRDARKSGGNFEKPVDFSVGEMFAGSFSAFQAGKVERIVLRLDAFAARLAAERRWHPSQRLDSKSDGGAELTLEVSLAPDLENWILGWGEHAEVIAPDRLREKVASTAAAMQAIYAKIKT